MIQIRTPTRLPFGLATLALATVVSPAMAADAPKTVLAQVSADFNGDGVQDRAVLLQAADGDDVDLAVYLSADGKPATAPSIYKAAFGWTGSMAGTGPELSVNRAGSLVVVFQNDSIGRDRWRRQYVIAFRDGAMVVAGYDYESRDTLKPGPGERCDINFLSGRGTRNSKPISLGAAPVIHRLAAWTDQSIPAGCGFD